MMIPICHCKYQLPVSFNNQLAESGGILVAEAGSALPYGLTLLIRVQAHRRASFEPAKSPCAPPLCVRVIVEEGMRIYPQENGEGRKTVYTRSSAEVEELVSRPGRVRDPPRRERALREPQRRVVIECSSSTIWICMAAHHKRTYSRFSILNSEVCEAFFDKACVLI